MRDRRHPVVSATDPICLGNAGMGEHLLWYTMTRNARCQSCGTALLDVEMDDGGSDGSGRCPRCGKEDLMTI